MSEEVGFWCGSYTGPKGEGEGIWALHVADDESVSVIGTAVQADSPSFLAAHPAHPLVYAAGEFVQTVQAYRPVGTGLVAVGEAWHAGDAVCHVALDPEGEFALACCWGDGQVVFYGLDAAGDIVSRQSAAAASDPHPGAPGAEGTDRQSRAHMALVLPGGRVLSTDLGYDLVRVWRVGRGGLEPDHEVVLPAASGPRHMVWNPAGFVYVISEISSELFVLGRDASGRFSMLQQTSATHAGHRGGDAGCEITLSDDAAFVHTTTRGQNVVTTHAVRDGGARLEAVADTDCGGDWPRHHVEGRGMLRVANQRSNSVATFRVDSATGVPNLLHTVRAGTPTCLLAADGAGRL